MLADFGCAIVKKLKMLQKQVFIQIGLCVQEEFSYGSDI